MGGSEIYFTDSFEWTGDFLTDLLNASRYIAVFLANFFNFIGNVIVSALEFVWNNFFSPAFTSINNLFTWIWNDCLSPAFSSIGDWFASLWTNISNFFAGIPEFFANFWNAFIEFMVHIFVPEEGYFDNTMEDLKQDLLSKIDYTEYQRAFNNLQEIAEGDTAGLDVNFSGYKVGDTGATISTPRRWVGFDFVLQHKATWFSWCRAVTWIFFIIYNLNQIIKLLSGKSLTDGINAIRGNEGGK